MGGVDLFQRLAKSWSVPCITQLARIHGQALADLLRQNSDGGVGAGGGLNILLQQFASGQYTS